MIRVLENEFYYLDNFQRVLDWIGERYGDLLDDGEQAFGFPAQLRNFVAGECVQFGLLGSQPFAGG